MKGLQTSIYILNENKERALMACERYSVSLSKLVNKALENYLRELEKEEAE